MNAFPPFPQPLNPGRLRHRITHWGKPAATAGTYGHTEVDWTTATSLGTFYCEVRAMQGRELEAASQRWAEARFRVTLHYRPGIKREDRLTWGERTLDILDAEDPDGTRAMLVMICREMVS